MKITKYREINKGNLVGFASVEVTKWGFYINDISVFNKNGFRWINFPARMYEVEGVKKYSPYCGFEDKATKEAFEKKFFEALDKHIVEYQPEEKQRGQSKVTYDNEELPF